MKSDAPKFLYHGSTMHGISSLEPRKRYTPGGRSDVPPRVYATDVPVVAAMHAFPWSSDEGIDIVMREGIFVLQVPEHLQERLHQSVSIYTLPGETFTLTEEEETGRTYHTEVTVVPLSVRTFDSVTDAVTHYEGAIELR